MLSTVLGSISSISLLFNMRHFLGKFLLVFDKLVRIRILDPDPGSGFWIRYSELRMRIRGGYLLTDPADLNPEHCRQRRIINIVLAVILN
jgi:hypothetical protein